MSDFIRTYQKTPIRHLADSEMNDRQMKPGPEEKADLLGRQGFILRNKKKIYRLLEILPGACSWSLILFPVWGSFFIPHIVAYYIIAFDVYWFYRSVSITVLAFVAHYKIKASSQFDWLGEVKMFLDWRRVYHIIIIPTYKEPLHILQRTLRGLTKQTYPAKKLCVCLAFEEREGENAKNKARILTKEFGKQFGFFYHTFHPDIAGEIKGKSSNTSWAAKYVTKKLVNQKKLDLKYITITSEDADAILHPNYFACLTFKFLDDPDREFKIFQPAIHFYNNIWRVPIVVRVFNTTASVVQTGLLLRKDRLVNFSTYSTSLSMIIKVGFWDTNVIPEDYRIFFKSYFALKGKVEVEPIFLPTFEDAAQSTTFFKTLANQYEQVKRWAWGASDDAYIIWRWLTSSDINFWQKTIRVAKVLEDHFLWPVNWFAITIGASLPPLLNRDFSRTILGKTLPQVSSAILTFSLISLVLVIFVDWQQRPRRPENVSRLRQLLSPLEYLFMPLVGFLFTALPGLDAHTRLMLGKYIEYRVTEKV
jgi:cellulose synthase/poly-beta-1,6-N-acetylglucosamine synthase-like glycosyltransferase